MVKNAYIPFSDFVNEVRAVEDDFHFAMLTNWIDGKIEIPGHSADGVKDLMLLHYPYQKSYMIHRINSELVTTTFSTDEFPMDYGKQFSLELEVDLSVSDFFKSRIIPFIESAISKEMYNKYLCERVLIGLERNTAFILSDERGWDVKYDIMELDPDGKLDSNAKIGKIRTIEDGVIYSLGIPMGNKFYGIYKDTGEIVFLGDTTEDMYSKLIVMAQLETDGTAYLYNNNDLE